MSDKIDALLYAAAEKKTKELELDALLPEIKRNARTGAKKPKRSRAIYFAAPFAACAAALILIFARTAEVEGKTYFMLGGNININGEIYSTNKTSETGQTRLVQLEGNKYAILPEYQSLGIMVFPPDAPEMGIQNENAVQNNEDVYSVEPTAVYPIVGDLVVRAEPDVGGGELAMLHTGQCVMKIGMNKNWAIIEWDAGIAYAFDLYLFEAPDEMPEYEAIAKYSIEELNVRSLPTSRENSQILGELQIGEKVKCTGSIGAWSQIEYKGEKAYVFSKYLVTDYQPPA